VSDERDEREEAIRAEPPRELGPGDREILLRSEGAVGVLPARGEGGLLRPGAIGEPVRLPLGLDAKDKAGLGAVHDETEAAWREFGDRLRAFVSGRGVHPVDVDDILQKVFLQLHRSRGSLRRSDRVGAWLYRTTRNAIADLYRAPARRRELALGGAADVDAAVSAAALDAEPPAEPVRCASCLRPLLDRLPETHRSAIELVELRGLTQAAAASVLGLSLPAMKARAQRARRRLKAALLECCRFMLDRRGGILACEDRNHTGRPCSTPVSGEREPR